MKIQEKDIYHGTALTQIVEHDSFTALNKADGKYGHYIVNHDTHIFVKVAKDSIGDEEVQRWQFTFNQDDLQAIRSENIPNRHIFICLVCGRYTICCLSKEQLVKIIDITSQGSQWLKVECPSGGSMRVRGYLDKLDKTIPHNSFPDLMFDNQ